MKNNLLKVTQVTFNDRSGMRYCQNHRSSEARSHLFKKIAMHLDKMIFNGSLSPVM